MELISKDENETLKYGELIGNALRSGDIISLNGDLGAGKTHMTKGIARGLGVSEYITSPTFIIVNQYEGRLPLYHFDVYRINDIQEMYEIGFDEYLYGPGVCVVEWGDIVKELLPKETINIRITALDDSTREICIDKDERFDFLRRDEV